MQAHVEALMKIVEAKNKEEGPKGNELGSIKLVLLSEKDNIEAYLVMFERIMEAHKVAKERWSHYFAPQLMTGKAQLAFATLQILEAMTELRWLSYKCTISTKRPTDRGSEVQLERMEKLTENWQFG